MQIVSEEDSLHEVSGLISSKKNISLLSLEFVHSKVSVKL